VCVPTVWYADKLLWWLGGCLRPPYPVQVIGNLVL
jgi:hypothetical protein